MANAFHRWNPHTDRQPGWLAGSVRADDLAAHVITALLARQTARSAGITDVVFGCANQSGEDNRNVARMALLLAGLPQRPGRDGQPALRPGLSAVAIGARRAAR
jgi:acetyl-CoA C-acetyltransferase